MERWRRGEKKRGREGGEARKKERERDMKREKGVQIYIVQIYVRMLEHPHSAIGRNFLMCSERKLRHVSHPPKSF
jgi:hypothetical protein